MSSSEADRVESAIQRFSGKNLKVIVTLAIAGAVWATTIKLDLIQIHKELETIKANQLRASELADGRANEIAVWRKAVDMSLWTLEHRITKGNGN